MPQKMDFWGFSCLLFIHAYQLQKSEWILVKFYVRKSGGGGAVIHQTLAGDEFGAHLEPNIPLGIQEMECVVDYSHTYIGEWRVTPTLMGPLERVIPSHETQQNSYVPLLT
jgi:hypothetical protein